MGRATTTTTATSNISGICAVCGKPSGAGWACADCTRRMRLDSDPTKWPGWLQRGRQALFKQAFARQMERLAQRAEREEAEQRAREEADEAEWDDDYAVTCDLCGTTFMCGYDFYTLEARNGELPEAAECPKCGSLVDVPREWVLQRVEEAQLADTPWF
jgi:hypothetical protein